jgi:hypothetical protein
MQNAPVFCTFLGIPMLNSSVEEPRTKKSSEPINPSNPSMEDFSHRLNKGEQK